MLRAYVATAGAPLDDAVEGALIAPWLGAAGQSAFYRQIAPGARLEVLPGSGHLVQEDEPDALTRLLAAQLTSDSAGS